MCAVGIKDEEGTTVYRIEHGDEPYGPALFDIKRRIERASYVVGFNIKFDLHWLNRYIPSLVLPSVFDCQLASFILNGQSQSYPALGEVATSLGCSRKLDRVSTEYWSNGIDTTDVPWDILSEYCANDVEITDQVHLIQRDKMPPKMKRMFALQCEDLQLLQDMEWNGLKYDFETASLAGQELQLEEAKIYEELRHIVPHPCVDFGSSDHLSVVLYGGVIYERYREQYTRTLIDGTIKEKERWSHRPVEFPRIVAPSNGTETKPTSGLSDRELTEVNRKRHEEGRLPFVRHWSVAEQALKRLRLRGKARKIVELTLRASRIRKLDRTYYTGLIKKRDEMGWTDDMIHGQFNQCVARTGRLSSSEPNEQNFDKEIKKLFYTRFN